jgi:hypothetical protein
MNRCILFYVSIFFFFVFVPFVSAQNFENIPLNGAIIKIYPPFPVEGDSLRAELESLRTNVHTADIEWYKNGVLVQSGKGLKTYTFTIENGESAINLTAVLTSPENVKTGTQYTVKPSETTIIWEAKSYTPPFFTGKPLQSPGTPVLFYAIPRIYKEDGTLFSSSELFYEWYFSGQNKPIIRGVGNDTVLLKNPNPFVAMEVVLHISDAFGNKKHIKKINVPTIMPEIIFYENHILRGALWKKAIKNSSVLTNDSLELIAEPYYYTSSSRYDRNLSYLWTISGQELDNRGTITLRPEGIGSGIGHVKLNLSHAIEWRQRAEEKISLSFRGKEGGENASETNPI